MVYRQGASRFLHFLTDTLHHVVEISAFFDASLVGLTALLFEVRVAFGVSPSLVQELVSPFYGSSHLEYQAREEQTDFIPQLHELTKYL